MQRILDAMIDAPALVQNGRLDILTANRLGRALYSELYLDPTLPVNHARFTFLDPRARDFYPDWDGAANDGYLDQQGLSVGAERCFPGGHD